MPTSTTDAGIAARSEEPTRFGAWHASSPAGEQWRAAFRHIPIRPYIWLTGADLDRRHGAPVATALPA